MGPRSGSYLDSSRHPLELMEAVQADLTIFESALNVSGEVSLLDAQLVILQEGDLVLTGALSDWSNGERIPRRIRRKGDRTVREFTKTQQHATDRAYDFLHGVPYEHILCATAQVGLDSTESVLHPGWNVTNFERWLRFGGRIAMLGLQYSILNNNAGRMPLRPEPGLLYDSLLRTACVSELVDNTITHALDYHTLPQSSKRKLMDDRAMLLENEAMFDAYEDMQVHPAYSTWVLPATPSLDFGAKVPIHADVLEFSFDHRTNDVHFVPVDIKRKSENRKGKPREVARIDAMDLDCVVIKDRKHVVEHAARSKDFIQGHIEMSPDSPFADQIYRTAVASGLLLVPPVYFSEVLDQ